MLEGHARQGAASQIRLDPANEGTANRSPILHMELRISIQISNC